MAAGHAVRGMLTAWLALVVLQTVSTKDGSGRVSGLFTDVDKLLQRAFDPGVPAIPDRSTAADHSSAGAGAVSGVASGAAAGAASARSPFANALAGVASVARGAAAPVPKGTRATTTRPL